MSVVNLDEFRKQRKKTKEQKERDYSSISPIDYDGIQISLSNWILDPDLNEDLFNFPLHWDEEKKDA